MRKTILLLFVSIILFSCSDNSAEDLVEQAAIYKIVYEQEGNLTDGLVYMNLISDAPIQNAKETLSNEDFAESGAYTFETERKAFKFKFTYTHHITILDGINEDSEIKTKISVFKDGVNVYQEAFVLNKANPKYDLITKEFGEE